jgi:hypothetical protein
VCTPTLWVTEIVRKRLMGKGLRVEVNDRKAVASGEPTLPPGVFGKNIKAKELLGGVGEECVDKGLMVLRARKPRGGVARGYPTPAVLQQEFGFD